MSKVEVKVDVDEMHENSLDNSADWTLADEGSYGSTEERSQLVTQPYIDTNDNSAPYNFKDLSSSVTYKLITMTGEENAHPIAHHSPAHDGTFYVISNPEEVFGNPPSPKKTNRRNPVQTKAVTAKKRDDKRRATHNEVERRRRDKINNWITKLAALVPNSGLPDSASKGGILAKACDHITDLTEKQKRLEKFEMENEKLVLEVLRLNQELVEVRKENTSMRNQIADNCIVFSSHRPKGQKS